MKCWESAQDKIKPLFMWINSILSQIIKSLRLTTGRISQRLLRVVFQADIIGAVCASVNTSDWPTFSQNLLRPM